MSIFLAPRAPLDIHSIPDTVLRNIFTLASSQEVGELPMRTVISHVTSQWRTSVIGIPSLWSNIRVTRNLKLDGLREIIYRSRECELDITFISHSGGTNTRFRASRDRVHFHDAARLLVVHTSRWRMLSVTANSAIMHAIIAPVTSAPLLRLCSLDLVQSDNAPVSHFGPFIFDPVVFSTLHLTRVTIHCSNPAQLANVTDLDFSGTSCRIIDQALLNIFGNVDDSTQSPCMLKLTHLSITAEKPQLPPHLSFHVSSLVSLRLTGFSGTSSPGLVPFTQLFNTLSSDTLRHLELDNILGLAWDEFIASLPSTTIPKYPGLQSLTLRSLELRNIDANFTEAFPAILNLNLFNIDPDPGVISFFRDRILGIVIMVNGLEHSE